MAQRDYEEQPEAPDLGATVQLETAESLVGPADGNDAVDAGYSPPDRPYALDDDELTVAGQAAGETLDERLAREVPEEVPVDVDRAGRLADPEQLGAMERTDSIEGQDVGIDGGAASAEEAAVHVVDLDPDVDPDLAPTPTRLRPTRTAGRGAVTGGADPVRDGRSGRTLETWPTTVLPARARCAGGGTRSAAGSPAVPRLGAARHDGTGLVVAADRAGPRAGRAGRPGRRPADPRLARRSA